MKQISNSHLRWPKGRRSCVKYISKERINNESMPQLWNALYKKLIAGFVMFLGVLFLGKGYQGNIIISMVQVVLGAVIYGIMLIVLKDKVIYDAFRTIKRRE